MESKRIMFLGAARFQLPPIEYARAEGFEVITVDNIPGNPGHQLADRTYNVSTVDQEAVLAIASQEKIDGILTFGSDVSASTVAYVGERLGLSVPSMDAVRILTHKGRFREFLNDQHFQRIPFATFNEANAEGGKDYAHSHALPLVIKPTDASGSRGVSVVRDMSQVSAALAYAYRESRSKSIIIEQFVQKSGYQVCGDGFMLQGRLAFIDFGDGHFYDDFEFLAPYAETFPGSHDCSTLTKLRSQLESILQKAGFMAGPFNFDVLVTEDGDPFVIELGPRSGGNYIPTAVSLKNNVDLVAAAVELCLNPDFELGSCLVRSDRYFACYMLHSRIPGKLTDVTFCPELKEHIVSVSPYLSGGEAVMPFHKAGNAVGNVVLAFSSLDEMKHIITNFSQYHAVRLETSYAAAV